MTELINFIQSRTNFSKQEALWLLQHVSGKKITTFFIDHFLTKDQFNQLEILVNQIAQEKKPLAYIIGSVPFLNLQIKTVPPILIPRHETEELVENIIKTFLPMHDQITTILDIGTGSGCIALALAQAFPKAQIIATDINPAALALAHENAVLNHISNISFIESNLFENLKNQDFDLIVSNPPYIDPSQAHTLPPEVALWEDSGALFATSQGLEIIVEILRNSGPFLKKNEKLPFQLIFEIGYDQKDKVLHIAEQYDWTAQAQLDSFGQWRSIWAKK